MGEGQQIVYQVAHAAGLAAHYAEQALALCVEQGSKGANGPHWGAKIVEDRIAEANQILGDVMLADQHMPTLNGTEFLNRVNELYPATVRTLLSGDTGQRPVTESMHHGAIYKSLTKPWSDGQVLVVVA
ncbi:hypothetical protein [Chitinimonas prasina]|uniref:hypothetical protein n=1 Tax=Chitinimonas prasina TaxID=1434937 RepID=UPI0024E0F5C0|nr:hypothetical protein [Chitinimonas prasina]